MYLKIMDSTLIKLFKLYLLLLKKITVLDFSSFIQLFHPATMQVSAYIYFLNYLSTISSLYISLSKAPYQPKLLLFWVILNSCLLSSISVLTGSIFLCVVNSPKALNMVFPSCWPTKWTKSALVLMFPLPFQSNSLSQTVCVIFCL